MKDLLSKWNDFWFLPQPCEKLACFRVGHGICLFLFLAAWWQQAPEWIGDRGFHLSDSLVPPLPVDALPFFAILQFGGLILLIAGWKTRLTACATVICLAIVTLIDRVSAFSINSIYLFTFTVLAVYGAPNPGRAALPGTAVRLLQVGLVAIYFSSGWNKAVYGDWVDSPTTLRTAVQGIYMTDFAAYALKVLPVPAWTAVQFSVLSFELFAPVLFFSRRARIFAMLAGCIFHLGIALFMEKLIFFSLQMMSFYVLFLPDEWLAAFCQRVWKPAQTKTPATPAASL